MLNFNLGAEFPERPGLVYLNSGNLSLTPQSVLAEEICHRKRFEENPTLGLSEAWGQLWSVQSQLADFLGAKCSDLFFRPNVTEVLNAIIFGAPLLEPSEILVSDLEYGAIQNICRFRCETEGHAFRLLKLPQSLLSMRTLTRESLAGDIISQLGPKTKMLVISHVIAGTGLVIPIREIAEETRKRNILLVVDGAYAPGAFNVDFSQFENIDFYGCSLYKWMMGPKGTAFGWVHPRHQATLKPITAGWMTFGATGAFSQFGMGSAFQEKMCLQGCRDFAPFFALRELFQLWRAWSPEKVWNELANCQGFLTEKVVSELGWPRLVSELDPTLRGPLLAFLLPDKFQADGDRLATKIRNELGIQLNSICLNGRWSLILSPHFYNTQGEMELAVGRLKTL